MEVGLETYHKISSQCPCSLQMLSEPYVLKRVSDVHQARPIPHIVRAATPECMWAERVCRSSVVLLRQSKHLRQTVLPVPAATSAMSMQGMQGSMGLQTSLCPTTLPASTRKSGSCARLHTCGFPGMYWRMWCVPFAFSLPINLCGTHFIVHQHVPNNAITSQLWQCALSSMTP